MDYHGLDQPGLLDHVTGKRWNDFGESHRIASKQVGNHNLKPSRVGSLKSFEKVQYFMFANKE